MTDNILFSKSLYLKKNWIMVQLAKELWYITTEKERSYIFFGMSKITMNSYPNVFVLNLHIGPLVFRWFHDGGLTKYN